MRSQREISEGVIMVRLTNIARVVSLAAALAAVLGISGTAQAQKQSPAAPVVVATQSSNQAVGPYEVSQLLVVEGGKDGFVTRKQFTGTGSAASAMQVQDKDDAAKVNVSDAVTPSVRAKWISYIGK
jgi:hypothetical protein